MGFSLLTLAFIYMAAVIFAEETRIIGNIGGDVTLPCQAKERLPFKFVEWSKEEKPSEDVLLFDAKNPDPEISQRFQGRVQLSDPNNGDVSLVLKNVTSEDHGRYKCYVIKSTVRNKRDLNRPQPLSTIYLDISHPAGNEHVGLFVSLGVVALISAVFAVFLWKKKKAPASSPDVEAAEPL